MQIRYVLTETPQ